MLSLTRMKANKTKKAGGPYLAAAFFCETVVVDQKDGALNAIRKLQVHLSDLFARYDLILTPSAAALPWPAAEPFPTTIGGRKVGPRGHAVFTGFVNMSGCPGISIPGNCSSDRLPIGFQLVAEHGRDGLLCEVAAQFELAHPWQQQRPMI